MNLIMLCYNFMRTINIMGFEKMMFAIKNWQPDYNKVAGLIKTAVLRAICNPLKLLAFKESCAVLFIRAA